MPHRLEIALKADLYDAEGESIRQKAQDYFGIHLDQIRTVHILTFDADLSQAELKAVKDRIFTNPVTQWSSYDPLPIDFDWIIWVGYRPGVRDNPGSTAKEAIEDLMERSLAASEAIYTSRRYCLKGREVKETDIEQIAGQLLANSIIQQWRIFSSDSWDPRHGIGVVLPKVRLNHVPTVARLSIDSDAGLKQISDARNLALSRNDIPVIRGYFRQPQVQAERRTVGLSDPTDVELEYISQARSDHCNHNTFRGRFHYLDLDSGESTSIDNLFKTYIEKPTLQLQRRKDWVVSVLWDNAGVGRFDDRHHYVITAETHNSPSNMEAYGGALTGIVGVYRDPLGTGKGSRLVMGAFGYCVGPRDYDGDLKPHLHPRRLLDGVVEGVRDGGNKSGIPTVNGQVLFDAGYLGKCLVFVTAVGLMPAEIDGRPAAQKKTSPGDLVIMCGGRVGKDGIHGVTASSETYSADTPAGHVQIGDPYTQKKMHDFLLEARDQRLIQFITDNGGGGLSSSVGESAHYSGGCRIDLERVPLKYEGLDQWEIWVSESQERMTVAIKPEDLQRFMTLSERHAVESTVIGSYADGGKLHLRYDGQTCAYVDLDFLSSGFPQWEFDAHWRSPAARGLVEPVLSEPDAYTTLLHDLLARPNICAKEWIFRQYDHEVQGTSVIKPLVGAGRDVPGDAAVIRPVLDSTRGLALAQALLPAYSAIDAYHMTTCTIDEAIRRLIAVGVSWDHIGGVDNFCWPSIQYHPVDNPDGKFKAAQLVRACQALAQMCLAYEIPLLSGKDSMYVDGNLKGRYGETRKISALETLQFTTIGLVDDITACTTMDCKVAGDLVIVVGETRNELGASEYYQHLGYVGCNVPRVWPEPFGNRYRAIQRAIQQGLVASIHGVYRGGLGVHLALVALGGHLGLVVDIDRVPVEDVERQDVLLFSESAGRFILTIDPRHLDRFADLMAGQPWECIGRVTDAPELRITGRDGSLLVSSTVDKLKAAWKKPFGHLV